MKKIALLAFILSKITVFAQNSSVNSVGSMSNMGKENFAPHIKIDTISNKKHLYGMGPLGRMQGEITVFDGKPYSAYVEPDGTGNVTENWQIEAPFFVYTNVKKWVPFEFEQEITSLADLEKAVAKIAKTNGYDLKQPFVFQINGSFNALTTHIVMPRSSEIAGFQPDKKQADYDLHSQKGVLLGVYSENAQGIYTHKDSFIHVHFISANKKTMGHVDKINTKTAKLILLLPFTGK